MQAQFNIKAGIESKTGRIRNLVSEAGRLSTTQIAVIASLVLLVITGSLISYLRSKPREITLEVPEERLSGPAILQKMKVHVAGAVTKPGLYEICCGKRVADAIEVAGGVTPDAALDDLNLAARVRDGQKILVPRKPATGSPGDDTSRFTVDSGAQRVNVNSASTEDLEKLPGIGPAIAARIVEYRRKHGPFSSVSQLRNVEGIGAKKLETIKDLITI